MQKLQKFFVFVKLCVFLKQREIPERGVNGVGEEEGGSGRSSQVKVSRQCGKGPVGARVVVQHRRLLHQIH